MEHPSATWMEHRTHPGHSKATARRGFWSTWSARCFFGSICVTWGSIPLSIVFLFGKVLSTKLIPQHCSGLIKWCAWSLLQFPSSRLINNIMYINYNVVVLLGTPWKYRKIFQENDFGSPRVLGSEANRETLPSTWIVVALTLDAGSISDRLPALWWLLKSVTDTDVNRRCNTERISSGNRITPK